MKYTGKETMYCLYKEIRQRVLPSGCFTMLHRSDERIFLNKLPIFRPLRFFRSSNLFKLYGTRFSYTRCREIFKECLQGLGHDEKKYGLHSLRSGD